MKILLTNDDGIFAPGISAIYSELVKIGDVTVVAPDVSRSGAGHSITYSDPIVASKVDVNGLFTGYSIQGSPADCVKLAHMKLHEGPIDLVVSGINNGANAGINVYYSGTVAAAMEAVFLKIPAVAISLSVEGPGESGDFKKAAVHCLATIKKLMPIETGSVFNINIPQLSKGEPNGIRIVPQAANGFDEYYIVQKEGKDHTVFQLAGEAHIVDGTPTDITSLHQGYITITPLAPDMTDHKKTDELKQIKW